MRNLIVFTLALMAFGCSDDENCKDAVCTEIFAMVTVKLTDSTNLDLSGISSQTILLSTGQTIHNQSDPGNFPDNGFIVADDSNMKEIGTMASQKLEFRIFKDGNLLKKVPFTIKTDCCHISKSEGPEEVSLN